MQANKQRHIKSGTEFNGLFPIATQKDTVVRSTASLGDTISLMRHIIGETKTDTQRIAQKLKQTNLKETCKAIWNFVYQHIQYKQDKTGIEQVRRPARSWADRYQGVDCDCYTVFISSILTNLSISHKIRITKYNGRPNFQHVYPIIETPSGQITMDCVTDKFNYEVPYSDHKDFTIQAITSKAAGLSGVDCLDLHSVYGLKPLMQPRLPLRATRNKGCRVSLHFNQRKPKAKKKVATITKSNTVNPLQNKRRNKQARLISPFNRLRLPKLFTGSKDKPNTISNASEALIKTFLVLGVGYGTYRLFGSSKPKKIKPLKRRKPPKNKELSNHFSNTYPYGITSLRRHRHYRIRQSRYSGY